MPTITPGYNFAATEIPNKERFLDQATGLSITGIDSSLIATGLIGQKIATSSTASLPLTGWLQFDRGNNDIWVKTAHGERVKIYRGRGMGMESVRFQANDNFAESQALYFADKDVAGTDETNTVMEGVVNTAIYQIRSLDSTASGAFPRVLLAGGSWQQYTTQTIPLQAMTHGPSGQNFMLTAGWPRVGAAVVDDHVFGTGFGRPYDHPTVGDDWQWCWFAGPHLFVVDTD